MWRLSSSYYRSLVLVCLLSSVTYCRAAVRGRCVGLFRDQDACPARTQNEEFYCLMRQNSMKSLMDCVTIDYTSRRDYQLCRDVDDGIPNNGADNYYQPLPGQDVRNLVCSTPRQVLIAGSGFPLCRQCSLQGLLKACPENDPDFHNCLCAHDVQAASFLCLSQCFMPSTQDITCGLRVRDLDSESADLEPPSESVEKAKRDLSVREITLTHEPMCCLIIYKKETADFTL